MARTKESGYKSQMYILLALRERGRLYGRQIVDETGLKREEVWRNLKVLMRKRIIEKEKIERSTYYEPIVNKQTLEYIISILNEGGLAKMVRESRKEVRRGRKLYKEVKTVVARTNQYANEILELGETPYIETLQAAKELREIRELDKTNLISSKQSIRKDEARKLLTTPQRLLTKKVTAPSGLEYTFRKLTLFEFCDMMKEKEQNTKKSREDDKDWIEAIRILLA